MSLITLENNENKFFKSFYKNRMCRTNQKDFRFKKVIKREGDKLYVKWKGYNSSFNSWIDTKRQV